MTETREHKLLKDVGRAFLFNQRCFMVATEVHLPFNRAVTGKRFRTVIDVCGFGEKYIPFLTRRYEETKMVAADGQEHEGRDYTQTPYKFNVLRGIEVKVSRGDLKNGYISLGCNYNYLMTPKGLTTDYLGTPQGVGIIEVDLQAFQCKFDNGRNRFIFTGLHTMRQAKFSKVESWQIDHALADISARCARELVYRTRQALEQFSNKKA